MQSMSSGVAEAGYLNFMRSYPEYGRQMAVDTQASAAALQQAVVALAFKKAAQPVSSAFARSQAARVTHAGISFDGNGQARRIFAGADERSYVLQDMIMETMLQESTLANVDLQARRGHGNLVLALALMPQRQRGLFREMPQFTISGYVAVPRGKSNNTVTLPIYCPQQQCLQPRAFILSC